MVREYQALLKLGQELQACDYHFTAITPASHQRVNSRADHRTEALAVERSLGELRGPSPLGRHTYWRARIAALVGERERAVTLLRESLQQGKEYFPVHLEADFETLRALPSFQELMRVKE